MGYSTEFQGELKFTRELTSEQLDALSDMLHEDCRDYPEWEAPGLYYIDLELTADESGLQWDGSEKTYFMDQLVNVVITQMRKRWPDFGLTGSLMAQGENIEDRWMLFIGEDGLAHKQSVVMTGKTITCPHCDERFELE